MTHRRSQVPRQSGTEMWRHPRVSSMTIETLYYTDPEVAALVRVSIPTVYRWIAQDTTFPALKLAGAVRVNRARLLKWLHDREGGRTTRRMNSQVRVVSKSQASTTKE